MPGEENTNATTETQNSETTETEQTSVEQTGSSSSDTTSQNQPDDGIDLGKGAKVEDKVEETDEAKAAREAKEGEDAERAKLYGAPEGDASYEITGLPEGVTVDTELLAEVTPFARQLNLSSEGLSLLAANVVPKIQERAAAAFQSSLQGDIVEQKRTWEIEARQHVAGKDAEGKPIELKNEAGETLSYDGKSMKEVQLTAARALDRLAPAGFRAWVDETGVGTHPMLIALAYNAGKLISEDKDFEPSGGSAKPKTREEKFYG